MNLLASPIMALSASATATAATIGKKCALHDSEAAAAIAASGLVAAGHDDDGEEILVEAEPLPHEVAASPELRCRYPSKHCLRARTVKKTGALHSMCAFHRAKANRNQRRLEKRKRLRLNSGDNLAETEATTLMLPTFSPPSFKSLMLLPESMPATMQPRFQSPREVTADLEPFRTPAALFPEDLEALCELVDVSVRRACVDPIDDAELCAAAAVFL
ncbi:hypothetical protein KRP22_002638 [Phytophthora ramorum]|nr:hypothetical protein KRP22_6285 [Phytophthora ramorum]